MDYNPDHFGHKRISRAEQLNRKGFDKPMLSRRTEDNGITARTMASDSKMLNQHTDRSLINRDDVRNLH